MLSLILGQLDTDTYCWWIVSVDTDGQSGCIPYHSWKLKTKVQTGTEDLVTWVRLQRRVTFVRSTVRTNSN